MGTGGSLIGHMFECGRLSMCQTQGVKKTIKETILREALMERLINRHGNQSRGGLCHQICYVMIHIVSTTEA